MIGLLCADGVLQAPLEALVPPTEPAPATCRTIRNLLADVGVLEQVAEYQRWATAEAPPADQRATAAAWRAFVTDELAPIEAQIARARVTADAQQALVDQIERLVDADAAQAELTAARAALEPLRALEQTPGYLAAKLEAAEERKRLAKRAAYDADYDAMAAEERRAAAEARAAAPMDTGAGKRKRKSSPELDRAERELTRTQVQLEALEGEAAALRSALASIDLALADPSTAFQALRAAARRLAGYCAPRMQLPWFSKAVVGALVDWCVRFGDVRAHVYHDTKAMERHGVRDLEIDEWMRTRWIDRPGRVLIRMDLAELMLVANYLECQTLLERLAEALAAQLAGVVDAVVPRKKAQATDDYKLKMLREYLGAADDFTAEEQRLRYAQLGSADSMWIGPPA